MTRYNEQSACHLVSIQFRSKFAARGRRVYVHSLGAESVMDTDPPAYNETQDPIRRLRASAPPPEFPAAAESTKGIELGSNNPFKNAVAGLSNERSVTFSKVADETIDQGSKSMVAVAPSTENVSGI